jgi:hypothetical protein
MSKSPFRPVLRPTAALWSDGDETPFPAADACCGDTSRQAGTPGVARTRLSDLDPHLHCSVIGTCLSTAELRKLMRGFVLTDEASDLEVHHEAVRLVPRDPELARSLHRALERRHEAAVQRFGRARDVSALTGLWEEALRQGEIPGAYWAILTHRRVTPELRQRVFGDVHMLSHLVGAANRADIRRLVALEHENAELRGQLERQHERLAELGDERDRSLVVQHEQMCELVRLRTALEHSADHEAARRETDSEIASLSAAVALQTRRREQAEGAALAAGAEAQRLEQELARLREQIAELARELGAAETQLHETSAGAGPAGPTLSRPLRGQRVLYVGGRPSSNPAIRDLVLRHGGEYRRHDGGIEDRKGLLAPAVAWATLVAFPVDCIDHDSALALKRICIRQGTRFLTLRSASVASFVNAVSAGDGNEARAGTPAGGRCLKSW